MISVPSRSRALLAISLSSVLALGAIVALPSAQSAVAQSATALGEDFDYFADFNRTQVLKAAASNAVIPASGDYTVEAWIKPRPFTGNDMWKTIVSQNQVEGGKDPNRLFLSLYWTGSRYQIHIGYGTPVDRNFDFSGGVPTDTWSHIALSVAGSTNKVFFNGVEIASYTAAVNAGVANAPFTVGATGGVATHHFDGGIDQVKVWNGALTSQEIQTSMHTWAAQGITGKTLKAHYDFNNRSAANSVIFDKANRTTSGNHLGITGELAFKDVKEVTELNGRQIFSFPRSYLNATGGFRPPASSSSMNALVVGGGGAGGYASEWSSGGGGGGEVRELANQSIIAGAPLRIQVAQGGVSYLDSISGVSTGGQKSSITQISGQNPTLLGESRGGGSGATSSTAATGFSDGFFTGGGGSAASTTQNAAAGDSSNAISRDGSSATSNASVSSQSGGGGAGSGGSAGASSSTAGGAGGVGTNTTLNEFFGFTYGGGGGGGRQINSPSTPAAGGSGGGGTGGIAALAPTQGLSNTGGGGGGAGSFRNKAIDLAGNANSVLTGPNGVIPAGKFTIEAWVLLRSNNGVTILSEGDASPGSSIYIATLSGGNFYVRWGADGANAMEADTGYNAPVNTWTHIALTRSSTGVAQFFVNGVSRWVSTSSSTSAPGTTNPFRVGAQLGNVYYLNGSVDGLKIWDENLSASELEVSSYSYASTRADGTPIKAGATLRALYDFNSFTPPAEVDKSGNNRDLTYGSAISAESFVGNNDFVGVAGANGGSGLVVVSVPLRALCVYNPSGFALLQDPKITLRPLAVAGPSRVLVRDQSVASFFGEPVIVNGKLYIPDRGRGLLRRMNKDGTDLETVGSLPTPGQGVATDGRYVYATSSTSIARYDTVTGVYEQNFIGKGNIAHVDGEIAFARFNGVGYLFIANNNYNVSSSTAISRIHAVPVSGAAVPAAINNTTHLFSESRLDGIAARNRGSSGLAVVGDNVYWSEFNPTFPGTNTLLWRKEVRFDNQGVPTNLPSATAVPSVTNYFADQGITGTWNSRAIGNDGTRIFVNEGAQIVRGYDTTNNLAAFAAGSVDLPNAGGFLPTAECSKPVASVQGSFAANQLSVNWLSPYGNDTSVRYLVEYRMNGGNWISGIAVAGRQSATFTPASALSGQVEVRVTTDTYTQLSEFSYSNIIDLTPPPPPPLCANPMRLEYDVPANTTVTLPLSNGPVSTTVTVRWAQGVDSVPITWTNGNRVASHTFATAGVYQVQVCGQFTGFGSSSVLHPYLTKVISWGEAVSSLTSLAYAFRGALILTDVPNTLPSGVTNLQGTFFNAKILNDADVAGWDVSNVTNLSETFSGASAFNRNLGSWNVTNVSNMSLTFANATAFNNGGSDEIKNWVTSNVTSFFGTFTSARAFNQPIGSWNTSSATSTRSMFEGAIAFNQPLANWTTTSVTSMRGMFSFAQSFNQNIGSWNTSAVTDFSAMFSQAIAFNNGGSDSIKNWNTAAATNMSYMFFQTSVFNQPLTTDVNKWNVANVTDMQYMFGKARVFNQDLTTWNVSNVTNMNSMFWLASAFNNGSAAGTTMNWNTLKVTNMNQMFFYASNFKRVLDFEIDALTTAVDMLSFSGLSDDQYGLTISDFENQFTAGGAQTGVSLGATDKTALCNTPQQDLLTLVAATSASGAGWTITDKTIRTVGHCTPQVTITAKAGSHVYGGPLPAIGYDIAVTNGSLPTSDWLNDVTCRAVAVSGGAAVTTTSAAAVVSTKSGDTVTGTYKTICSGPTGTGLGINITYKDNVYAIEKRPIAVRAVDQAVFAGQATLSSSASSSDATPRVLVTAGSILAGDVVNFTLTFASPTGTAGESGGYYTGDGTYSITPALSTGDATPNYSLTASAGTLTVTTQTYIISAKTQTKSYGDEKTFGDTDWTCAVKTGAGPTYISEPCTGTITVELASNGAGASAGVNNYAITVGNVTGLPNGALVEKVNGNLIVKKRPLLVTANSKQVAYGSAAPNYDFTLLSSEFRNGNGANTVTGITCSSEYVATGNGKTPRGTVLPITCSGGSSDFYELVYVAANLTVLEDSQVASDVPQEIRLAEDELSTKAAFAFNLTPVNEICFANLVVNFQDGTSRVERVLVTPGSPVSFSVPLDIGEYDYSLAVDGNCSIPPTSGNLRILEYVAPEPEPQQNPSSNPVLLPSINSLSERQLPTNQPAAVSIRGERLNMVTEITVGGVKVDFTINLDGSIRLSLPALRAGTYDMVVFHSYGSLTYPGAFIIGGSTTPISGGQTIPSDRVKSRTLRFTNFAGDGFRLPSSARTGITRVFKAIGDVDRVVCRGLTSARRVTPADQRLAENRAREACNLARQLAPTASIELRTSPAAGIGPRFRAVNLFILYNLD